MPRPRAPTLPPGPWSEWLHPSEDLEPDNQSGHSTCRVRKIQADEWEYDMDDGKTYKICNPDAKPDHVYDEDGGPNYEYVDSSFHVQDSRCWRPGCVIKVCWREPIRPSPEFLRGAQWPQPGVIVEFNGVRLFLIIATDGNRSICTPLRRSCPTSTSGGRPALHPKNHGMIYDTEVPPNTSFFNPDLEPVRMVIGRRGDSLGVNRYFCYHYRGFTILDHDCQVLFMGDIDSLHFDHVETLVDHLLAKKHPRHDLWSICGKIESQKVKSTLPPSPKTADSSSNRERVTGPQIFPIRQRPKARNEGKNIQQKSQAGPSNVPSSHGGRTYMPTPYTYPAPEPHMYYTPFTPPLEPSLYPYSTYFDPRPATTWDEEPTPQPPFQTQRGLRRRSSLTQNRQRASYETRPVEDMEEDLQEMGYWASSRTRSPTPHPQPRATSTPTPTHERPASRDDFQIAFICALPIEKTAVQAMFDDDWDIIEGAPKYGTAQPDTNAYSHGRIGSYNVVVANIGGMGKRHAAAAATHICHTWPKLQLILVVGICGAVPFPSSEIGEIILGDVVISSGVIQYDFGRRLDSGFVPKKEPQDLLPGPRSKVRPLLDKLRGVIDNRRLRDRLVRNLGRLEADADLKAWYLGANHDVLFRGDVRHVQDGLDCRDAGCQGPVYRERLVNYYGPRPSPAVHIGLVGSADTVMKSGSERDRIARDDGIIAFEMEGAGVWGDTPCLVIKGVCDYADGHKMKKWQSHAAAAAAAGAAAFLDDW